MRILHVSNFVQKHNGRLYWNMPFRINNGMTRLGHNVLNFSDRDIARDNILRSSSIGKSDVNNRLIITCKNYQPDLIILGHSDIIANLTLSNIRNILPNCKIIMWNVDHLLINNTLKKYIKSCNNKIANVETDIIDSAYFENLSKILECFKNESSEYKSYIDEMVQGDEYYWVTSAGFKDWFDASRFDNFQIY